MAIVHDNPDVTRLIRHLLTNTEHHVCWDCTTSKAAINLCRDNQPDLLLLKLDMPDMPATDLIRHIMVNTPTTIIVISQSIKKQPGKVFEAMSAGALDAFSEPSTNDSQSIEDLQRKIRNINSLHKATLSPFTPVRKKIDKSLPLIAIGASTGGPAALVKVLAKLPVKPHAVIVVIQHMDKQFSDGMARWIDEQVRIKVEIAQASQVPEAGCVYLAAGDDHLVLNKSGLFEYTAEPVNYPYRPSVDVFFESAVANWPNQMIGVLLTGMGRDGANGLLSFYNRGMLTIAQNEESCAVFGMPKAAISLNAAQRILHLDDIGDAINDLLNTTGSK
ncbi:MAG: chemotaxis-specific protein-glutamate methyltransferase CheB [Gammaproteobacteria bacterium]|nr:chemotaxis-specific protein-glutamate methyltransferase CheB [Gammaproteobacteria bacterium]